MRKFVIPGVLVVLVLLVVLLDKQRRNAQAELKQLSVKMEQVSGGDTEENRQRAKEVLEKVSKLMDLDLTVAPTVAAIVDVEKLRERNSFYNKAKNGDFLIITPTRAILFDMEANRIVDVVPVQIEDTAGDQPAQ